MTYQYLVNDPVFPYCAGCGHTWINKAVAESFAMLNLHPSKINLVSDIGCVGLVDKLFLTNTIHTTHGRSTAFASGLELADKVLFNGDAVHVVMIGDGGASLGIQHLIEAAKLNLNMTVILHNNFVYGMTGGQNSSFTPEDFRTATTMNGNLTPALNIAKLLEASHASYISRKLATDRDLAQAFADAIKYPGFSLVEVIELCTGYATKWNSMTKKDVEDILVRMDCGMLGNVVNNPRENFTDLYTKNFPISVGESNNKSKTVKKSMFSLELSLDIIFAGSAGEGVQFCAKTFAESCLRQGYNIMQKNDNPVTIGTGFSLAEMKISNKEILYFEVDDPDYFLISSLDGLQRVKSLFKPEAKIIIDSSLLNDLQNHTLYSSFIVYSGDYRSLSAKKDVNFMLLAELYKLVAELDSTVIEESLSLNAKSQDSTLKAFKSV
jgi:2-oxoglutarate/2-oxoacid ferredoxin oxidoreductase subunit beta